MYWVMFPSFTPQICVRFRLSHVEDAPENQRVLDGLTFPSGSSKGRQSEGSRKGNNILDSVYNTGSPSDL